MASLTDDLRYLSRAGYRDPWAEAVKTVSSDLLSLANTKMRRDSLIAETEYRNETREAAKLEKQKNDAIRTLGMFDDPETQKNIIQSQGLGDIIFGENQELAKAYVGELDKKIEFNDEYETAINPDDVTSIEGLSKSIENINELLSNPNLKSNKRIQVNTLKTNFSEKYNNMVMTESNLNHISQLIKDGYLSDTEPLRNRLTELNNQKDYKAFNQVLNQVYKRAQDKPRVIRNRVEELVDNYFNVDATSGNMLSATAFKMLYSAVNQSLNIMPKAYSDLFKKAIKRRVPEMIEGGEIALDKSESLPIYMGEWESVMHMWENNIPPLEKNMGMPVKIKNGSGDGIETDSEDINNLTIGKPITKSAFGDFNRESLWPTSSKENYNPIENISMDDFDLPDSSIVDINLNGTVKSMTGDQAKQLLATGKGSIIEDTAVSKLQFNIKSVDNMDIMYKIPVRELTKTSDMRRPIKSMMRFIQPRDPRFEKDSTDVGSFQRPFGQRKLQNKDILVNLKTKKRYPVIINKKPTIAFMGRGMGEKGLDSTGEYIINGKKLNIIELMNQYGFPLFEKEVKSFDTNQSLPINNRTLDTNIDRSTLTITNQTTNDTIVSN